jgi:hypothetical protein
MDGAHDIQAGRPGLVAQIIMTLRDLFSMLPI